MWRALRRDPAPTVAHHAWGAGLEHASAEPSEGTRAAPANATAVRLADCFREAVRLGADSLILVHNHPSGDPTPSPEDVRLTADAARAGEVLGIAVLDHIVIGRPGYFSLRERGLHRQEDYDPLRLERRDGGDRGAGDGGAAQWPVPLPAAPDQ